MTFRDQCSVHAAYLSYCTHLESDPIGNFAICLTGDVVHYQQLSTGDKASSWISMDASKWLRTVNERRALSSRMSPRNDSNLAIKQAVISLTFVMTVDNILSHVTNSDLGSCRRSGSACPTMIAVRAPLLSVEVGSHRVNDGLMEKVRVYRGLLAPPPSQLHGPGGTRYVGRGHTLLIHWLVYLDHFWSIIPNRHLWRCTH
ncbi:hypothetical protein J6590_020387 [Homalodisca vitripennis]|nr:hypothetical protein J6590_020387 [Homalodisca vitripennis]